MVQESWTALQAIIAYRDVFTGEIRDAISEGVAANNSLVEDGSDIEIKISWLQTKPTHRQIMKGWC